MRKSTRPDMEFYGNLLIIWSASTTLTAINASENIALGKATNQSSIIGRWNSSKAVDGCALTNMVSDCCTHTDSGQTEAWWQVDLQTPSIIEAITILYRDEGFLITLAGYEIYLSYTHDWKSGNMCHKDTTPDLSSMTAVQNVECPGVARYLTIYNDRRVKDKSWYSEDAVLELCEVQVYGCLVGKYGNGNCNHDCVNCLGDICDATTGICDDCSTGNYKIGGFCVPCPVSCVENKCESDTGACSDGCSPGFSGTYCRCPVNCRDISCPTGQCTECHNGFYGSFCNQECPVHCKNSVCNMDSGQCTDCVEGYHGRTCAQPCPINCNGNLCIEDNGFCTECVPGMYGSTCDQTCSNKCKDNLCSQGNGFCNGCQKGYHGNTCQHRCPVLCKDNTCSQFSGQCEECAAGYHGIQCNTYCPSNCKDNVCDQSNGRCIDCEGEFHGNNCSLRCQDNCKDHICIQDNGQCIECVSGFYGNNCLDRCGNCQDGICDKDTGNCMSPCLAGLTGERCDVKVAVSNVSSKGDNFKPAAIGIAICSGVVIVALVIVIIVLVRRKQSGNQRGTTRSTTMTSISLSSIGQELRTETGGPYEVIDDKNRVDRAIQEVPTDNTYERLRLREREPPHI